MDVVGVLLLAMAFIIMWLSILLILTLRNGSIAGENVVTVLVVGDIARSPRMRNHTTSLAKHGFQVQHVGYGGTRLGQKFAQNDAVEIFLVCDTPEFHKYMPKLLAYIMKVVWQSSSILWTLCKTRKSSHLILQNPPAIPTIGVAWLFCLFRCTRLLIDWHNYGYSILALALRKNHPLVKFSRWYERWFGQLAFWGFTVTEAMKKDLHINWNIRRLDVLYDRASEDFKSLSLEEKHKICKKLSNQIPRFKGASSDSTAFTRVTEAGTVELIPDRPALLVSSTSWTEDEDFSLLLTALDEYDKASKEVTKDLPDLVCVITGKGPQKEHYLQLISDRRWSRVSVSTPWLESEDYPRLLGAADLGVSLHYSSSGLDLPMKVVDMFGTGLPVCAVDFHCLSELVKDEKNGLIFRTSSELFERIQGLLARNKQAEEKLGLLRENLKSFQELTWEKHWEEVVLPVLYR